MEVKKEVQVKDLNLVSKYLLPALRFEKYYGGNFRTVIVQFDKKGFINAYLGDDEHEIPEKYRYKDYLFLLFNIDLFSYTKEFEAFEDILKSHTVDDVTLFREEYIPEAGLKMYIFEIPEKYKKDLERFLIGKYSEFSEEYKGLFNKFVPGTSIKTVGYQVVNNDPEYREIMKEKVGNIPRDQDLESTPYKSETIYRYKKEN